MLTVCIDQAVLMECSHKRNFIFVSYHLYIYSANGVLPWPLDVNLGRPHDILFSLQQ